MVARERVCLFCQRAEGPFRTREHVVPESLGNVELVLPPGVVCDGCNNGPLSELDQTLCEFAPIVLRRTMLGVRSKAGKVPEFRMSEGRMSYAPGGEGTDPTLMFMGSGGRSIIEETGQTPDGLASLRFSGSGGRRMTARYASTLSRALLKMGLECAWIDLGEEAFDPRFDHIRSAVLGKPRDGFFAMLNRALDPNDATGRVSYRPFEADGAGTWRMWVAASFLGVILATDSRLPRPGVDVDEQLWSVQTFTAPPRASGPQQPAQPAISSG